jgi:hypothetical protein
MPAPTAIIGLADAKAELDITVTDYDVELQTVIDAAQVVIEDIVGPVVQQTVTGEQHRVLTGPRLPLLVRPVVSVTSCTMYVSKVAYTITIAADPTLTGVYGATLDAEKGVLTRWTNGVEVDWWGSVYVTYVAGRDTVPANIAYGTKQLVRHMWETQRGQDAGLVGPASYDEPVLTPSGFLVPNRVMEAVRGAERLDGFA